jgi:hypothetical protein
MPNGRLKSELFSAPLTLPERAYIDHLISSNYVDQNERVLLFATAGMIEGRASIFERIRHDENLAREEIRQQKNRYARELRRYVQHPADLEWEVELLRDIHPTFSRDQLATTVVASIRTRIEHLDALSDNLELEQYWHLAINPHDIFQNLSARGHLVTTIDPKNYPALAGETRRIYAIDDEYRVYEKDKVRTFLGQKLV